MRSIIRYSYERVPTIRDFANSDKRIRGLMGPFGSGKSSGCVMEIVRRALQQEPSPRDGIRKTRWAIIRNCYSDDTEILTDNGWKLFKDLKPDDKVAQLNPTTDTMEFVKPTYYYKEKYKGKLIGIESESISLLVTPDHKLYVSTRHTRKKIWSDYHFEFASDCYSRGDTIRFKITSPHSCSSETIKRILSKYNIIYTSLNNLFEFFGFWLAEGYAGIYPRKDVDFGKHYRLVLIQKKYISYVRDLLKRNNFSYTELWQDNGVVNFVLTIDNNTKNLIRFLIDNFGKTSKEKFISKIIKESPVGCLRSFLYGFQMGDGSFKTSTKTVDRLYTSSKQLANDLQEICLRIGRPAILHQKGSEYYITILTDKKKYPVARKQYWYEKEYDGTVYCIEVPTHIILVRRNGKVCWCSQSYPQLRDTTIKTVLDWLPPSVFGEFKISTHDYIITGFPGCRIELMFRALDKPEHVANLLSLELTGAWVNEAREVPKEIIDALDGRIGRYPSVRDGGPTWYGIIMDTNPPDEDSWWYEFFEEQKPPHAAIFKQPSGLSPEAENLLTWEEWEAIKRGEYGEDEIPAGLRPDYYIRLAEGKTPDYINVYIHGNYGTVKEGKPVFERTFNPEIHISNKELRPIHGLPLIIGMDFGLTPSAVFMQLTPKGRLIVFDELYDEGIGILQFTRTILKPHIASYYPNFKIEIVGDPAGMQRSQTDEKTCFEVLRDEGFKVRAAKSNAISLRINALESFLTRLIDGQPAFQVSKDKCPMLIKGFMSKYCWRKKRSGGYADEIEKNKYSHPMDACGYGASYFYEENNKTSRRLILNKQRRRPATYVGY